MEQRFFLAYCLSFAKRMSSVCRLFVENGLCKAKQSKAKSNQIIYIDMYKCIVKLIGMSILGDINRESRLEFLFFFNGKQTVCMFDEMIPHKHALRPFHLNHRRHRKCSVFVFVFLSCCCCCSETEDFS